MGEINNTIYRTPDHWVKGGNRRMFLYIADLSPVESDKILPIILRELKGGIVTGYSNYWSVKEDDNRAFMFSQPGYVEGEAENVSRRSSEQHRKANHIRRITDTLKKAGKVGVIGEDPPDTDDGPLTIKALRIISEYESCLPEKKSSKLREHIKPDVELRDHIRPRS